MEYVNENINTIELNIETFSKMIGDSCNIDPDTLKNYLLSNISVGLTTNNEMLQDIQKLYLQDKFKYYNAAKNSTCVNNIILTQGTLEQEINSRRTLGILLIAEIDFNLRSKVIKILRKHYSIVYTSVKKHDKKSLSKKYLQMDEVSREIAARLDSAVYFYFSIYRSPEMVDQGFIRSIITEINNFQFTNPIVADISNELEIHKSEIQGIKALIKREYGKVNSFKDILNNTNKDIEDSSNILKNLFIINKLDINYTFSNSPFINIDEILLAYIKSGNDITDYKIILHNLINGIFIKSLLNEYKSARSLYFQNNQETLLFNINSLEERVSFLEAENKEIKHDLNSLYREKMLFDKTLIDEKNRLDKQHKDEIKNLKGLVNDLEKQLQEEKKHKSELNALREYVFEQTSDYTPKILDKTLTSYISDKKLIIIGGSKDWRRKFRDKYPEIRTLHGFNENFDISILAGVDFIFFYTGFMNHSTYYKAMNFIRANQIKFSYIGKTNMDLVEEEIIEELQKL